MKSLAVVSQKGGVGKTTLSLNLAFALARANFKVALVDADPQGAVGHSLRGAAESPGLAGYAPGTGYVSRALLPTRLRELGILPTGDVAPHLAPEFFAHFSDGNVFAALLDELAPSFDLVLIDTPSGFNGVTLGALRAVDAAISPIQAEPVALRTFPQLLSVIGALREQGARVELAALVICMLQQRNSDSLAVAEEVWARLPAELVLETTIPRDSAVLAASTAGVPLGLVSRLRPPPISLVFDQLAAELAPRLGLVVDGEDEPIGLFA